MVCDVASVCVGNDAREGRFVFENKLCRFEQGLDEETCFVPIESVSLTQCPDQFGQYDQTYEGWVFCRTGVEEGGRGSKLLLIITENETEQDVGVDCLHVLFP